MDASSLAHTKWECQYHIVFAPKYRRQIVYGKLRKEIGTYLRALRAQRLRDTRSGVLCGSHTYDGEHTAEV